MPSPVYAPRALLPDDSAAPFVRCLSRRTLSLRSWRVPLSRFLVTCHSRRLCYRSCRWWRLRESLALPPASVSLSGGRAQTQAGLLVGSARARGTRRVTPAQIRVCSVAGCRVHCTTTSGCEDRTFTLLLLLLLQNTRGCFVLQRSSFVSFCTRAHAASFHLASSQPWLPLSECSLFVQLARACVRRRMMRNSTLCVHLKCVPFSFSGGPPSSSFSSPSFSFCSHTGAEAARLRELLPLCVCA